MGRVMFPPCCLAWGKTMVGVMKVMVTSFKRTCAGTIVFNAPDLTRWWSRRMCTHLLLQELQNYNLLLNNHQQEKVGFSQKKTPHVQGYRISPRKMVGGTKSCLESNPIPARDAQRAQTKPWLYQDQETPQRLSQTCLWVFECYLLQRYGSAVACLRGRGSGYRRPGHIACGISPIGGGHH